MNVKTLAEVPSKVPAEGPRHLENLDLENILDLGTADADTEAVL